MDPTLREWLELVVRWAHVVTGIAWIGASFYFNWLLNHLTSPEEDEDRVAGELWAIHAGGFFKVQKRKMAAGTLPAPLHWFKWEAYWTWITGFLLLVMIYYLGASVYLIDRSVADISPGLAIAIGIGTLVASWFAYDLLWRSALGERIWLAGGISLLLVVAITFGLTQVFSARAAYVHVGAMLGTLMVGNVFRVIMPAQRELVAATGEGREQDASLSAFAEQRSLHNNYMTLPVLFVMISNHYPSTYGHPFNWAILLVLFLAGALVRYYFNVRHKRGNLVSAWALAIAALAMVALFLVTSPERAPEGAGEAEGGEDPIAFSTVKAVLVHHCGTCHSAAPTHESFDAPPLGFMLDTPAQMKSGAAKILARAVVTNGMPLGNETGMTQQERDLLGNWIYQGARID
jgi:uncharacterized membrane protein